MFCTCGQIRDKQLELAKLTREPEVVARLIKISEVKCPFCEAYEKALILGKDYLEHGNLVVLQEQKKEV